MTEWNRKHTPKGALKKGVSLRSMALAGCLVVTTCGVSLATQAMAQTSPTPTSPPPTSNVPSKSSPYPPNGVMNFFVGNLELIHPNDKAKLSDGSVGFAATFTNKEIQDAIISSAERGHPVPPDAIDWINTHMIQPEQPTYDDNFGRFINAIGKVNYSSQVAGQDDAVLTALRTVGAQESPRYQEILLNQDDARKDLQSASEIFAQYLKESITYNKRNGQGGESAEGSGSGTGQAAGSDTEDDAFWAEMEGELDQAAAEAEAKGKAQATAYIDPDGASGIVDGENEIASNGTALGSADADTKTRLAALTDVLLAKDASGAPSGPVAFDDPTTVANLEKIYTNYKVLQPGSSVIAVGTTQVNTPTSVMTVPTTQVNTPSNQVNVTSTQINVTSTQVNVPSQVMSSLDLEPALCGS